MYQHIMVPLDGSKLAECVLPHVESIAGGCNVVKVTLVRAVEPLHLRGGLESRFTPQEREHIDNDSMKVARGYLEQIAQRLQEKGITAQSEVLHGKVADSLLDYAHHNDVDLIIMATHGHSGVSRWMLGSVADRLLRSVAIPVMTVRAHGKIPPM